MEEKKVKRRKNSVWSFFSFKYINNNLRRKFFPQVHPSFYPLLRLSKNNAGLTLVELLVVIIMLGIIIVTFIAVINPNRQLGKTKDSQRQHDLEQIKNALDLYYHDNNSYPVSLTFGSEFSSGSTVYMKMVPNNPDYTPPYVYQIDSSNPHWAVLYAKLTEATTPSCPLSSMDNCLPLNYDSLGYNFCITLGDVDCSLISSDNL